MNFASEIPEKISYKIGNNFLTIFDDIEIVKFKKRIGHFKPEEIMSITSNGDSRKGRIVFFGSGYGEFLMSQFLVNGLHNKNLEFDWWITSFYKDTTDIFVKRINKKNILNLYEKSVIWHFYRVRPSLLCIIEYSFPYIMTQMMRLAAGWLKIPVIMLSAKVHKEATKGALRVNGSMLDNLDRYLFIKAFKAVSFAVTDDLDHAERLNKLNVDKDRIAIGDSLKWYCVPDLESRNKNLKAEIRSHWQIGNDCLIIVAGSVHALEAFIVLDIFCRLKEKYNIKMIFAPHISLGLNGLKELLRQKKLSYVLWSQKENSLNCRTDVIIVDSFGKLAAVYETADIAYVGGSFEPDWCGHNVVEPISYGIPTLIGPSYDNFRSIVEPLKDGKGILVTRDPSALYLSMEDLIGKVDLRQRIGKNAEKVFFRYFNKTPLELDLLQNIIDNKYKEKK